MPAPATTPVRRLGAPDSTTRAALVQAGIDVLQNEGSAAFTAKRVAEQAGLKPQLVHYYFRTMEDLVLAIIEHAGGERLRRAARAVASDEPLRELWTASIAERSATLVAEVQALAQHSEAIRQATVRQMSEYRLLMTQALEHHARKRRKEGTPNAMTVVMITDAIARLLVSERSLGFSFGHHELYEAIESWLDSYYAPGGASSA